MRLTMAVVLSGAGLTVGLVFDVHGLRRRLRMQGHGPLLALAAPRLVPEAPAPARRPTFVGGLDGCRRGWVLVVVPSEGRGRSTVRLVSDLQDVLALLDSGELLAVGIDIPIGLPAVGPRRCDVAARRRIGPRSGSVFPAPPRPLLGSHSYEEALRRCRAVSGKGISQQAFGILPKIEAVDGLMTPDRQYGVVEAHPELSFTLLAGHPMDFPKSRPEGRAERLDALRAEFADVDEHLRAPLSGARVDDVLDAFACAWTARRWVRGTYERFGGELDPRGLRMEIIG